MTRGVCFSGGGIKCAAHIGALKACEEFNLKFDYISGTSSGSIITILYALDYSPDEMYEIIKKYVKDIGYIEYKKIIKLIFDLLIYKKIKIDGLNSGKKLEKIIKKICENKNVNKITDINKTIFIPSVDLCDGKIYIFSSKKLRDYSDDVIYDNDIEISKAVRASCSYPGIFKPCNYKNSKLIDGGIRENIPWKQLKDLGTEEIWGITFTKEMKENCNKNIINIISDSISIMCHELSNYELKGMQNRINVELKDVDLLDYKKIDYIYEKGYLETKKYLEEYFRNKQK